MVRPAIIGQQREDGTGQHEAACSRPRRRAPGAGILAGAATGSNRAVGIEVVQALDGWLARRREFTGEDTRRGAGEDLGDDRADRRAPSISDGDAVRAGKPAHAQRWAGSARAGPAAEKTAHDDFSNPNPFSN
jgi:hypothetical protein